MILAAALLLGSVAVGWWSPRLLGRLAATRTGPGVVIAWWLLTAAGVATGAVAGVLLLVLPGHGPADAVIRLLHECWAAVDHDGLPALDPIVGAVSGTLLVAAAGRLAVTSLARRRRRNVLHRHHLTALRLTGARTVSIATDPAGGHGGTGAGKQVGTEPRPPAFGRIGTVPIATDPTTDTAEWLRDNSCAPRDSRPAFGRIGNPRPVPTLWLPEDRPLAYSLGGRRPLVVASSGLAARLTERELGAVLAHERAHVRGHHHLLTGCSEVLGRALRFVPLMHDLPGAVRLLVELSADRTAAARCGREPLRSALLSIRAVEGPRRALAMAGGDTAIRLRRLDLGTPAGRRSTAVLKTLAVGFAAFLAPSAVAVLLIVVGSLFACP